MNPAEQLNNLCRNVGSSMIAFGVCAIAASTIASIVTDRLMYDCLVVAMIPIGAAVRRGGPAAVKWGVGGMAYYLVAAIVMEAMFVFHSPHLKIGGRVATMADAPWLLPAFLAIGAWASINLLALLRIQQVRRRIKRGLCVKCGYDLRGGRGASSIGGPDAVTCPECGATR